MLLLRRIPGLVVLAAAVVAAGAATGCRRAGVGAVGATGGGGGTAIQAVVSIAPLKGIIEPLLPAGSTVQVLVPVGVSEHGYEIPAGKLASLAQADLVVTVGLGLDTPVEKFLEANPNARRQHVSFAIAAGVEADEGDEHDHAKEHGHAHTVDPHLWLAPGLAKLLAPSVKSRVRMVLEMRGTWDSAASADLDEREKKTMARIQEVHVKYSLALEACPRKVIVVAHDAYGHLAERYGLEVVAVQGLTASEPTPGAIRAAVEAVKSKGVTTVFVEPQLSQGAARRIAEATGAKVQVLDPLGNGDWFDLMERNLSALTKALGGK